MRHLSLVRQVRRLPTTYRPFLLHGMPTLTAAARVDADADTIQAVQWALIAIPYYAWANRGKGEMTVWFPAKVLDVDLVTRPTVEQEAKK